MLNTSSMVVSRWRSNALAKLRASQRRVCGVAANCSIDRPSASALVRRPVVRELVRPAPDIIGFRICIKLHGLDGAPPLDEGFAHPMHSVHHRAVGGANDRIPQFYLLHKATVRGKRPPGRRFVRSKERVVELLNL